MEELDRRSAEISEITVISSPTYSWILRCVYHYNNTLGDFRDVIYEPIKRKDWLLIADEHFRSEMKSEPMLSGLYEQRETLTEFNSFPLSGLERVPYPYNNYFMNVEGCDVEIAANKASELDMVMEQTATRVPVSAVEHLTRC